MQPGLPPQPHHRTNNKSTTAAAAAAGNVSTSSAPLTTTPAAAQQPSLVGRFVDPKKHVPVLAETALPQVATLLVLSSCCVGFVQGLIASVDVSYRAYGWEAGFWLAAAVTCLLAPIAWSRGLTIRLGVLLSMVPLATFIWIERHFGALDRCTETVFLGKALAVVFGGVGLGGFTSFTYASLLVSTSPTCLPAGAAAVASASTIIETLVALAVEVTRSDAPLIITDYTDDNDLGCELQVAVDSNSPFKVQGVVYGSMGILLLSTLVCSLVLAPHHSIRRSDGDSIDTVRYKNRSIGAALRRLAWAVGMAPTVPLLYLVASSLMTAGLCLTLIAMYRVNLSVQFFRYYNTLYGLAVGCSALIQIPSSLLLQSAQRGCTQRTELLHSARTTKTKTHRRYSLSAQEICTNSAAAAGEAAFRQHSTPRDAPKQWPAATEEPPSHHTGGDTAFGDSSQKSVSATATAPTVGGVFPLKHYRRQLRLLLVTTTVLFGVEIATGLSGMFHSAEVVKLAYILLAVTTGIPVGLATPLSNWYVGALCGRHLQTTVVLLTCHAIPFLFRAYQSTAISLSQSRHSLRSLMGATGIAGLLAAGAIFTLTIRAWRKDSDAELRPDENGMTYYARLHFRDRPADYLANNLLVLQQQQQQMLRDEASRKRRNDSVCTSPPPSLDEHASAATNTDQVRRLTQQRLLQHLQQQQTEDGSLRTGVDRKSARRKNRRCCGVRLRSRLYVASDWVTAHSEDDDEDDDDGVDLESSMPGGPVSARYELIAAGQQPADDPLVSFVSSPMPASGRSGRESAAPTEEIYLQLPICLPR